MKIILMMVMLVSLPACSMFHKPWGSKSPTNLKSAAMEESKRVASDALLEKGKVLLETQGDVGPAIDLFQEAVNLDPTNGAGYYLLSLASFKQGDYEKSKGFLQKAETLLGSDSAWKEKLEQLKKDLETTASSR